MRKKLLALVLCVMLLLAVGCGAKENEAPEVKSSDAASSEITSQVKEEQNVQDDEEEQESVSEVDPNASPAELAESCVGRPIEDLFALIGEPMSSEYAPSCVGDGEDGNLYYEDFIVYTYRENDEDIVQSVEAE